MTSVIIVKHQFTVTGLHSPPTRHQSLLLNITRRHLTTFAVRMHHLHTWDYHYFSGSEAWFHSLNFLNTISFYWSMLKCSHSIKKTVKKKWLLKHAKLLELYANTDNSERNASKKYFFIYKLWINFAPRFHHNIFTIVAQQMHLHYYVIIDCLFSLWIVWVPLRYSCCFPEFLLLLEE